MSKPQSMLFQNSQHMRVMQLRYRTKYKKLKNQIKMLVFDNAALCDEVAQVQADLAVSREDRKYLLRRLLRHEDIEQLDTEQEEPNAMLPTSAIAIPTKPQIPAASETQQPPQVPRKRGPKKRDPDQKPKTKEPKKPKANKVNTLVDSKMRPLKMRNKLSFDVHGKPMFPINLYSILVHSAGEIIPLNPNFHNAHWIYPVGYVTTRIYAHPKDPTRKCVYTCKILNNAGMPMFLCIPDNDLDSVFFGETANACHHSLLETLQRSLSDGVQLPMHVQGEKFFGLSNATVKSLLQMDPGFKQCAHFRGFVEPGMATEGDGGLQPMSTDDKDPTISFDALQSLIALSAYRTMPLVRDEPPDELFDFK